MVLGITKAYSHAWPRYVVGMPAQRGEARTVTRIVGQGEWTAPKLLQPLIPRVVVDFLRRRDPGPVVHPEHAEIKRPMDGPIQGQPVLHVLHKVPSAPRDGNDVRSLYFVACHFSSHGVPEAQVGIRIFRVVSTHDRGSKQVRSYIGLTHGGRTDPGRRRPPWAPISCSPSLARCSAFWSRSSNCSATAFPADTSIVAIVAHRG